MNAYFDIFLQLLGAHDRINLLLQVAIILTSVSKPILHMDALEGGSKSLACCLVPVTSIIKMINNLLTLRCNMMKDE